MTTIETESLGSASIDCGLPPGWFWTLVAALRRWHDRSKTRAQLSDLDDYLLKDVGVDPEHIRPFFPRKFALSQLSL